MKEMPAINSEQMMVNSNLLLTSKLSDGGYSNTSLSNRLGQSLQLAEQLFGPRNPFFTILGVDFTTVDHPTQIFVGAEHRQIIVLLTQKSALDEMNALYTLGHETFHLLSPGATTGTFLEEGLAVYLSHRFMVLNKLPVSRDSIGAGIYLEAYDHVCALLRCCEDMKEKIREFRREPEFRQITSMTDEEFKQLFPLAPDPLRASLLRKFYRNGVRE
ncbi:MAG TPA: hypothetical protein VK210_07695 [Terriglobia bacterium]|nr:hypothetical protein [Terriglobia bacterium]